MLNKSLSLTRQADAFTLVIPLSGPDCDEVIATVHAAKQAIAYRPPGG